MLAVRTSLPPVRRVVRTAIVEALAVLSACASTGHRPAAGGAPPDPAREFPEAGTRFGSGPVVLDALARSIHNLPRYAGVGDGDGYPLLPAQPNALFGLSVALAVLSILAFVAVLIRYSPQLLV